MEIHLIYASTSGNVERVVETVAEVLSQNGFEPELHRSEQTLIDVIKNNSLFIIATSTWEHGALNPFFVPLFKEMQQTDLHGKRAAFIGLGDMRYEPVLFTEGMEQVREMWLAQGGEEVGTRLKIQGEPYAQLENHVKPWVITTLPGLTTNAWFKTIYS